MRDIHPDLLDCLRRANPYVEIVTELSAPDISDVLRRVDQFTGAKRVSVTPANSMATSPRGPLTIGSGTVALANFPGEQGSFDLNRENPIRRLKGARFKMDSAFIRAVLRTVTVRVSRDALASSQHDWELQIYRVTRTPGVRQGGDPGTSSYRATAWTEYTHRPLLNPAVVIKGSSVVWDGALKATLAFDLSNHGFVLENTADEAVAADQVAELPSYYFVVKPVNPPKRDSAFEWLTDTATPRVIAGVGTFERVFWARDGEDQQWSEDPKGDVPNIKLDIDQYQASTQVVYALDLTRAPASGTTGRITFERLLPPGTAATLELSTAGAGGPWAAVKHGDVVVLAQQTYHVRLTLNADAALRSSPGATAIGVEFRRAYDVGVESIADLPEREIAMPWLKASIPTGGLDIVRTGARDYLDVATTIGSKESPTKLEAEIFLASRHPSITRDKWLRLERLLVTDREPMGTHEKFALTSYAARLKRKVPEKKETISSTHTVQAGSTAAAVLVAPPLVGATPTGNEYDNNGYYIRVQSLVDPAATSIPPGHLQTIQGNTGTGQLDFVPALPAALAAGDIIEVHSGIYQTQVVTWQDADPADVWWELWTSLVGFPPERIGLGTLPRGGRPPTLADRAPGDVATQNKLRITRRLSEEESAYEIADQLDFIMGGATVEIDGQICFVQIFALRDAAGVVTVPLPPVSVVLDPRDYASPKFPPGIERRATVLTAKYGKNSAASNPDAFPERITTVVDNDAFAWLAKPEIEDLGIVELPDSISRWLYNTTDSGLYLATSLAKMLVNATATGLRVFTLPLVEAHPELMPGDTVVIVTDSYTDYDPATQTELRGWLAIRGVVIGGDSMGRELKVFVAGLADNVVSLAGGAAADLTGLGATPDIPTVGISFNADGTANIDSTSPQAVSHRIAFSSVSQATADAAVPTAAIVSGNPAYAVTGSTFAPGAAIYVAAIAISATSLESAIGRASAIREGAGTAEGPRARITRVSGNGYVETVQYNAYNGPGQAGAFQTIERSLRSSPAEAETFAPVADGSTETIAVDDGADQYVNLHVVDAGGREAFYPYVIRARIPESTRGSTRRTATGRSLTDAAQRRSGMGGTFTRLAAFITGGLYGRDGARLLVNPDLERVTADLDGPTGIGMDVVERGGNKGDIALDAGNVLVAGSADFTRAYPNKNLGNIPDDATTDRRAATANEKTGGSRGFSVIDTGLLIVAAGIDFVRSYTNKHLGNLPDDATSDRRAATLNQKTGGDRGAAAIDAGNVAVAAAVDFTRAYTGKNLANVPDDATSDRRAATANEKTGGSRGYTALDSTSKLVTGVTSAATAADGLTGIASKRAAVRAAGSGSTAPAHARRRGEGGTASSPFTKEPVYTADGSLPLINTLTEEVSNARIASSSNFENPGGTLGSGVKQTNAGAARSLAKGYQSGYVKDGVGVTFAQSYQNPPMVLMSGGIAWHPDLGTAARWYEEFIAQNLSGTGFTCYAKVKTKGTVTQQTAQFTAPLSVTAAGDTVGPATLVNAPSSNNSYKVRWKLTVSCTTTPEIPNGSVEVVVAIETNDGVNGWIERYTRSRTVSRTTSGTTTTTFTPEEQSISDATLGANDTVRLKLKSITITGADTIGSATLEGFNNDPTSEGNGVEYSTSADVIRSKTPDAEDYVFWESFEVVQ